jgi:hypothetical protein
MTNKKEIIYEHKDNERVRYLRYKDKLILLTANFVADMGFSGDSDTAQGFLIGEPEQLDKESGKYISKLEEISKEERSEIYAQLKKEINLELNWIKDKDKQPKSENYISRLIKRLF